MTKNERNVVRNEIKNFNEKTGLALDHKVMERIIGGMNQKNMNKMKERLVSYVAASAGKSYRKGEILNVSCLGFNLDSMIMEINNKTSLNINLDLDAVENAFNNKLGDMKVYEYEKLAYEIGKDIKKNGVTEDLKSDYERERNEKLAATMNYIYDVKNGNATNYTASDFERETAGVANMYMATKAVYERKNFFGKWFTSEGWFLRGEMKKIETTLDTASKALGKKDSVVDMMNAAAKQETVTSGIKESFLNAKDLRVLVAIDDRQEEEALSEDKFVEESLEDSMELDSSFAC